MRIRGREAGEFLFKAETLVAALDIRPWGDGYNRFPIALPNGFAEVGLPGTERTVRGFSAVTSMVIDEASAGDPGAVSRGDADAGGEQRGSPES